MNRTHLHGHGLAYEDTGGAGRDVLLLVHGTDELARDLVRPAGAARAAVTGSSRPTCSGTARPTSRAGDYSLGGHAAACAICSTRCRSTASPSSGTRSAAASPCSSPICSPTGSTGSCWSAAAAWARELNLALRAATLPGSELVLPVLAAARVHKVGDSLLGLWSTGPLPGAQPRIAGRLEDVRHAWPTRDTRRAFLATSRSVIGWEGQTVTAPQPPVGALVRTDAAGLGAQGQHPARQPRPGRGRRTAAEPGWRSSTGPGTSRTWTSPTGSPR